MKCLQNVMLVAAIVAVAFTSCKKDIDPIFVASAGSQVQFNGVINSEAGSAAGNSVYIDFSSNTLTTVARAVFIADPI